MAVEGTEDVAFKVVVLGDSAVGKSCIVMQAAEGKFLTVMKATIGCDYAVKRVKVGARVVKLDLWDTAGQEAYRAITRTFYRQAQAAVLVYNLTKQPTFQSIGRWLQDLREHSGPDLPVYLAGNMQDLRAKQEVATEVAREFCRVNGVKGFAEISAKTGFGLSELFSQVATDLLRLELSQIQLKGSRLSAQPPPQQSGCCS